MTSKLEMVGLQNSTIMQLAAYDKPYKARLWTAR